MHTKKTHSFRQLKPPNCPNYSDPFHLLNLLPVSLNSGQEQPHVVLRFTSYVTSSLLLSRFHLAPRMCLLLVYRSVRSFKYLLLCTVFPRSGGQR